MTEKYKEIYQRLKKENPCIFCVQYDGGCQLKGHSCNSIYLRMYYEKDYSEIEPFLKNIYIKELEKELEESKQANEWHYPSKGEYPKENKRYLCKIKAFVGGGITYECFDYDVEYNSWKHASGDILAWKEITFPTEVK